MLKRADYIIDEIADRAKARSAFQPPSVSELSTLCFNPRSLEWLHQYGANSSVFIIDLQPPQDINGARDLTALVNMQTNREIVSRISEHVRKSNLPLTAWFAGVSFGPRRHPWDEQELSFPTKNWIVIPTENAVQAQEVARELFRSGLAISPIHCQSTSAWWVFAYALNEQIIN